MKYLQMLADAFFFPGSYVLKRLDITIEEDGGILRSFVNMCVWGTVVLLIGLNFTQ
ncbi:MAG: hypothetical protein JKX93_10580 [Rhizobiaceae bacterium]|nr:hypothetical protein [Rhizobiaceae bacterium]